MRITVETYDGVRITGRNWEDILRQMKAMNFSQPQTLEELMASLARRIKIGTGEVVGVGTYADFGHELARIGYLKIMEEKKDECTMA